MRYVEWGKKKKSLCILVYTFHIFKILIVNCSDNHCTPTQIKIFFFCRFWSRKKKKKNFSVFLLLFLKWSIKIICPFAFTIYQEYENTCIHAPIENSYQSIMQIQASHKSESKSNMQNQLRFFFIISSWYYFVHTIFLFEVDCILYHNYYFSNKFRHSLSPGP